MHEFNYDSGEIRYDINYDSINALAAEPPSQDYLDIIQRGREELAELRRNPDALRNKKDLKFEEEQEKERLVLEARQLEDAKRNQEERIRQEQKRRDKREEEEKRKVEERQRSVGEDDGPVNPAVVAFAAIAGGAGVAMSGSGGDDESPVGVSTADNESTAEEMDISSDIPVAVNGNSRHPEEDEVTRLGVSGVVNGMSTNGDTEDSSENMTATGGTAFNEEEYMADVQVEDAMESFEIEDYDEAWLGSITDILEETEVDANK